MTTEIEIRRVQGEELYQRDINGHTRAFVYLDLRRGRLSAYADVNGMNTWPAAVHEGHAIRWSIPPLTEQAANALLEGLAPQCVAIVDGYDTDHNGRGTLDEEAREAEMAISSGLDMRLWDSSDVIPDPMPAWEWLRPIGRSDAIAIEMGITYATSDADIEDRAETEVEHARREGYRIDVADMVRELRDIRDELEQPGPEAIVDPEDACMHESGCDQIGTVLVEGEHTDAIYCAEHAPTA